MKLIICNLLIILFLSCENKQENFREKIKQDTGIEIFNSICINKESSCAIGDYSESKTIKMDSLNIRKIYNQVINSFNQDIENKNWKKLPFGYRFEYENIETNEYYQYEFSFIDNEIFYMYLDD